MEMTSLRNHGLTPSEESFIAVMWDQYFALGTIEAVTGVSAARCCIVAKEYWAKYPGENTRPLVEVVPPIAPKEIH